MSLIHYVEGEENDKEDSIDKYKDLFINYKKQLPTLSEALSQMFISSGADENNAKNLIKDILDKCKQTIDNNWNEITNKYKDINRDNAYIICSYTCEALESKYSPYKILNTNLVSENRKNGINNISKYLYIFLKSLRKLTIYYPKQYLYRCLTNKVSLENDPNNEKWVPYKQGNQKTFWGFTSTSPNIKTSLNFLKGEKIKYGTIFSIGGYIWGYDITLFNYFKEEEILLEPQKKYKIDIVYIVNDVANVVCKILKTPQILDDDNISDKIYSNIEYEKGDGIKDNMIIKRSIVRIEMEIKKNNKYEYILGTGFLCYIKSKNMKVLITYDNIIDEEFLNNQKKLIFFIQKEKKEINMKIPRYKNIIANLNITNFIEIDDYINSKNYNNEDIIFIKFDKNNNHEYLNDRFIKTDNNYSFYSIDQLNEGIIILKNNLTIIGIFKKAIIPMNIVINKINFIKGIFEIMKEDIGKEIQILNNSYNGFDPYIHHDNLFIINKNFEIDEKIEVIINGIIKRNIFKYKFNREGIYTIYYLQKELLINMSFMFYGCNKLKEIYLSNFNTDNIKGMKSLFSKCSLLKEINFSSFNTSNVITTHTMFKGCSLLKKLDLSSFDTSNVTDMYGLFMNCSSLKEINL